MKRSLVLISLSLFVLSGCVDSDSTNIYRAKAKTAMDRLCVNDGGVFCHEIKRTLGYEVICKNGKTLELTVSAIEDTFGDDVIAKLNEITKK